MAGKRTGSAERQIPHTRIEDESVIEETYVLGEILGQGSFGVVREATRKEDGTKWAIKKINKEKAGSSAIKLLEREVTILKRVNHIHIIHLEEIFETAKRTYLIMELCNGGELQTLFRERQCFTEDDTRIVIKRLASAISYLHKHDIVHRDIKLENILLSSDPKCPEDNLFIKVTDFGLSVVKGNVNSALQTFCGTPIYMAPEVIKGHPYTQQCDVWSMGIIAYTLMCGSPPFTGNDEDSLYDNIKKGELDFSQGVWPSVSDAAKDAIQSMLTVDTAHRKGAWEILDHHWITGEGTARLNVLDLMNQFKEEMRLEKEGQVNGENNNNPQKSADANGHAKTDKIKQTGTKSPSTSSDTRKGSLTGSKKISGKHTSTTTKSGASNGPPKNPGRSSSTAVPATQKTSSRPRATAMTGTPNSKSTGKTGSGGKPSSPKSSTVTSKPTTNKKNVTRQPLGSH
ncbi:serine/threonine-protein kinase 33-like [Saccoglossus kowalevskii]|uniref:Serine/threonine-protein kinase 33-like n=1 Tax=Saccoglossus kowalevskii TaxID=10224 RepID=A0ABM0GWU8_SACKO|nr:PREDICTED: serine/threonine-protein kinase 33-like [Saccoglossus kowalevskii]